MRIGFYAHHHGSGHLRRARTIAAELTRRGHDTSIASSRAGGDIELPLDNAGDDFRDPTAHGAFHWAPAHNDGMTARMAWLTQWVTDFRPDVIHVDVSVEVAVFLRLLGVPVTVQAMPGVRDDAPHQLAYRVATRIIAAWPDWVEPDAGLKPHADRLTRVGGISRFEAAERGGEGGDADIIVMRGAGGHAQGDEFWEAVADQVGDARWRILGGKHTVADPSPLLSQAELVISAAGQNSVADIAACGTQACGTPVIVTAEERPFDEQGATAQVLERAGLAYPAPRSSAVADWVEAIAAARGRTTDWAKWQTTGAAKRAADAIEEAGK